MIISMSKPVCVTNRKLCSGNFLESLELILSCGIRTLILREKDMTASEYKKLASDVINLCDKYGANCILHSFTEVADELGYKKIHLTLPMLRALSKEELNKYEVLGCSCHSLDEIREAGEYGVSYVIVGHIFETECKRGLKPRGLDFLREAVRHSGVPVYAIGGINPLNIASVYDTGVVGVCLMSSLMRAEGLQAYLKELGVNNEVR